MARVVAIVLCIWFAASILTGCGRHRGARGVSTPQPAISGADVKHGKLVYERECAACHGQYGTNGPVGPALKDERSRKSFEAVRAIVTDPDPPMPKLYPARLTRDDVIDVSAYVESL
jgi:mono/diheme cytochrome c family protein